MNRIELSINSKYSGNSLVDINELISKASGLKLEGIAITDFNDVNSFFEIERAIKNYRNLDIIYGTKIKVKYKDLSIIINILVRNKKGLKNLYKILTLVNTQNKEIDIYKLFDYSDGLFIGLNIMNDNIYELLIKLNIEEIYEYIKIFDYLIVSPSENHNYIKKIVDIAKYYHKLIIASSNVRYLNKEDKKYYEIFKGNKISDYNYLMSTSEMLNAFSYLSKTDQKKLVIDNPHIINSLIDKYIPLIKEIKYYKEDNNKTRLKDRVYKRANKLYKNKIPKDINKRIKDELFLIDEINAYNILINSDLVNISEKMGYMTFTRGTVASSYINYLLGITKVNPLDYNLDYKEFYKYNMFQIAINYDERVVKYLIDYLSEEFGKSNVFRCGSIGYMSDSVIKYKIKQYEEKNNTKLNNSETEIVINKLSGIKKINGMLVGTYFCLPKYLDSSTFSPLIDLNGLTTMIDYHKIHNNLLKINILKTSYNSIYDDLIKITNIKHIDLNDSIVWDFITFANNIEIFKNENIKNEITKLKPTNIKELALVWINAHKTKNWKPSMAHAIEYALVYYKLTYIKYYYKDIYYEVIKKI